MGCPNDHFMETRKGALRRYNCLGNILPTGGMFLTHSTLEQQTTVGIPPAHLRASPSRYSAQEAALLSLVPTRYCYIPPVRAMLAAIYKPRREDHATIYGNHSTKP